jgi:hypothetical protein
VDRSQNCLSTAATEHSITAVSGKVGLSTTAMAQPTAAVSGKVGRFHN